MTKALPYFLLDDKKANKKKYYKYLHSPPYACYKNTASPTEPPNNKEQDSRSKANGREPPTIAVEGKPFSSLQHRGE